MRKLTVVVAAALAALVGAAPASAEPCPDRMAFFGGSEVSWSSAWLWGVYTATADGSNVFFGQSRGVAPAVSPSGNQVVYQNHDVHDGYAILTLSGFGGGAQYHLYDGSEGGISEPGFSPDGNTVVFGRNDGNQNPYSGYHTADLYAIDIASDENGARGTNMRLLVDGPGNQTGGSYSPDGSQIVYHSDNMRLQTYDPRAQLFVTSASGGGTQQLTSSAEFETASNGKFSPDGTRIVFEGRRSGESENGVFVMSASGGGATKLATGERPEWSTDGSYIVYAIRTGQDDATLWRVGAGGGGVSQLPMSYYGGNLRLADQPAFPQPSDTVTYDPGECGGGTEPTPDPPPIEEGNAEASTSEGNPSTDATGDSALNAKASAALAERKGGPKGDPLTRP
jgi:Tol biopolymer transport system component